MLGELRLDAQDSNPGSADILISFASKGMSQIGQLRVSRIYKNVEVSVVLSFYKDWYNLREPSLVYECDFLSIRSLLLNGN